MSLRRLNLLCSLSARRGRISWWKLGVGERFSTGVRTLSVSGRLCAEDKITHTGQVRMYKVAVSQELTIFLFRNGKVMTTEMFDSLTGRNR